VGCLQEWVGEKPPFGESVGGDWAGCTRVKRGGKKKTEFVKAGVDVGKRDKKKTRRKKKRMTF